MASFICERQRMKVIQNFRTWHNTGLNLLFNIFSSRYFNLLGWWSNIDSLRKFYSYKFELKIFWFFRIYMIFLQSSCTSNKSAPARWEFVDHLMLIAVYYVFMPSFWQQKVTVRTSQRLTHEPHPRAAGYSWRNCSPWKAFAGARWKCEMEGAAEKTLYVPNVTCPIHSARAWTRNGEWRSEIEQAKEGGKAALMFLFVSHYSNLL